MPRIENRLSGRAPRSLALALVPVLMLVLCAPGAGAGSWGGKEVQKEGVRHVMNPADSIEKPTTIELEEEWRIGGEDDEEIFGVITDIIADDDGNFYLLDAQLNEIKVYSARRRVPAHHRPRGRGPRRVPRRAVNMFLLVPGGNIGVLQAFPGKIVMLTPEGDPAGEFPLPESDREGFRVLLQAEYAGDNLAVIYALEPALGGRLHAGEHPGAGRSARARKRHSCTARSPRCRPRRAR